MARLLRPVAPYTPRGPLAGELKSPGYELFIVLLSLLAVVNLLIFLAPLQGPIQQVAFSVNLVLAPVFLVDFLYRLLTTHPRRKYLVGRFGWADALAIIPFLAILRIFRVVRVVRLLRVYGGGAVAEDLMGRRASATFFLTMFLVIAVVEFASMGVYWAERSAPGANITNAADAIWWGLVTITTVGYGDRYPVTAPGRIVGSLLLFAGIALFSVLTGFIANFFLAPRQPHRADAVPGTPAAGIAELRALLEEQEERSVAIRAKLDELEKTLDTAG